MSDYLYDKTGTDPDVAELEGLLRVYAHRAPLREPPPSPPPPRRRWRIVSIVTAASVAALAIAVLVFWPRDTATCTATGDGFAFAVAGGPARCGGVVSAGTGTLPIGTWLETSTTAVADVRVADIGKLTVHGDSRLRLLDTSASGHRMELARGKLTARVTAPPRLFIVDTPVATAVDLGCAYELVVDADGRTHLRVDSGAVSLEGHGLTSYAPMDTEVIATPGRGPGTPVALSAPQPLRAAVARFDAGDATALPAITSSASVRDTITLWNLLSRTTGPDRQTVVAKLDQLSPHPDTISRDDLLRGSPTALEAWRESLEDRWLCPECFDDPKD